MDQRQKLTGTSKMKVHPAIFMKTKERVNVPSPNAGRNTRLKSVSHGGNLVWCPAKFLVTVRCKDPLSPNGAKGGLISLPSPPWGRGWRASGAFISRGGPGEGVSPIVNSYVGHHTSTRRPDAVSPCPLRANLCVLRVNFFQQ